MWDLIECGTVYLPFWACASVIQPSQRPDRASTATNERKSYSDSVGAIGTLSPQAVLAIGLPVNPLTP